MKLRTTIFTLAALAGAAVPAAAQDRLSVMLDWFVNPDHATLVVAQERGYFAEAGLAVTLKEPADPNDPPKLVAAGKEDIAISYQPQLHLHAASGLPLVRIATIVATPLNCLVVLQDGPIKGIADLKGKKIGFSVGGFEDAMLRAMLSRHGLGLKDITLVNVNFSLSPALISGQVDGVIGAFRNFELNQLDILKRPGRAFYVEEEGVPAYDELIAVVNKANIGDPRMRKFVAALERSVLYLINHPDESWQLFLKGRKQLDDELNKRAWRDTLPRFALRPAALDRGRYERFAVFLKEQELIKTTPALAEYAAEIP
jgi:putative hydroxymethylpyrimidine transport system substrate-binding protein